jgi:ubiquinone/menaquinone biosynthesis C-methylase UbiE
VAVNLGFRGEVADLYHRYRRGYPSEVIDVLVRAFSLTEDDVVIDVGCGTGQLTLPIAGRVRTVLGVDPEPDMLQRGREAATDQGVGNAIWVMGSDSDTATLGGALVHHSVGAVTIAQALHWMDYDQLFPSVAALVRPGGGVAVVTNGTPLWLQESAWSKALRAYLEEWFDTTLTATCGTDAESQQRYKESLEAAGFDLTEASFDYSEELGLDDVVGGVYSALGEDRLPAHEERAGFSDAIWRALKAHQPFVEPVHVAVLTGRVPANPGVGDVATPGAF